MHEMTPGGKAKGHVIIDGIDIYDKNILQYLLPPS
jgi:hypothetical protein